jgi:NADPH2:quinone reductase
VIATVSGPNKARLAQAAGAHHVADYSTSGVSEQIRQLAPDGVDTIVEVAAAANADLDRAVLKSSGTISSYGNDRGTAVPFDVGAYMALNARLQFIMMYTVPERALAAGAKTITSAFGALPIGEEAGLPLLRFPLEKAAEAHLAVESGFVGKVLIDVDPKASE